MHPAYYYLGLAIIAEVIATSALKASEEFSRLIPSILVIGGYATAFYLMATVVKTVPVGVAYAIWAGVGLVLIIIAGAVIYRQLPDVAAFAGMLLIVAGIAIIHLFSRTVAH
jgi:small multidrug resistance pump